MKVRPKSISNRRALQHVGTSLLFLSLLLLLIAPTGYSTTKGQSGPTTAPGPTATDFNPFLDIVPSDDGTALFIQAGGVGQVGGTVFANIGVGPGHKRGSHTMSFSNTVQSYVTTAIDFDPQVGASGPLNITTTLGLDTGVVDFNRAYLPAETSQTVSSLDGILQLSVVSTDTFPSEAYVAVVPSFAPPGPLPADHHLVGSVYSVRASGAILTADRPMSLRLFYDDTTLAGADPHTLAIFAWDAFNQQWDELGGTLFTAPQQYLSVPTSRLTTYALLATTTWRDNFDEFSGLDFSQFDNVTLGGTVESRTLTLASTPGSGSAVSQPITPTALAAWDSLSFEAVTNPPTTSLSVDILSPVGDPLLSGVVSGTDLADQIDPTQYPSLRLRVNLSSAAADQTPALERWALGWQVEENRVYLPLVLK